ncbi:type II secretion system F family protein [Aeromicrobium sp. CTD01-1L150]|uniref:type II secretion system F family protein n=1 Tax=Aeromicrobium sp. CTD01-1L150 TaxID=3341830 RepID=UPI0035C1F20C
MLLLGAILILGAAGLLYVAIAGVPAGRVSRQRVDQYAGITSRPALGRAVDSAMHSVDRLLSRGRWRPFGADELELAGVKRSAAFVVVVVNAAALATFLLMLLLGQHWLFGLFLAALAPVVAKVVVQVLLARRRKRFAGQLAALLGMMAASLRAGHSLPKAMDAASRDADTPMSEELSRVVNEYRIGRDLVEAMGHVAVRMRSMDFGWIAQAIETQRETGGNLNEILDQVAETIRERQHIRMQVMALSAEGRLSAYILMFLPVGIGVYYSFVAADRMSVFIDSGIGKVILLGSAVLYVLGGFWMRSIVRIEF